MNPEEIFQALFQQNLRFEVILRALIEVLSSKKNADGTPLVTVEEVNAVAERIKQDIIAEAKKPQIVVPQSGTNIVAP